MSDTPEKSPQDFLNEIMDRALLANAQTDTPAQAKGAAAAAQPPVPGEPPAPGEPSGQPRKNTSVYIYLAVLFATAFAVLLLAYFVQQRNDQTAMDDLRDAMNLSREELLGQISALEEENTALNEEIDRLNGDLAQWQERYDEQVQDANGLYHQFYSAQEDLYAWSSFWELEQYYQAGDLQSCAAVLILRTQGQYRYSTPDGAQAREAEIVRAVIDAGVLDQDYLSHLEDYEELFYHYNQVILGNKHFYYYAS